MERNQLREYALGTLLILCDDYESREQVRTWRGKILVESAMQGMQEVETIGGNEGAGAELEIGTEADSSGNNFFDQANITDSNTAIFLEDIMGVDLLVRYAHIDVAVLGDPEARRSNYVVVELALGMVWQILKESYIVDIAEEHEKILKNLNILENFEKI